MAPSINYNQLMQKALRRVMIDVLEDVAVDGLPGDHHFFISFDTGHPDVDMPEGLKAQHPDAMTIVLQNWFDELVVSDDWFEVTLSFSGQPVRLHIPFDAVQTFVDPSVEFGLRFDEHGPEEDEAIDEIIRDIEDETDDAPEDKPDGEVVSLDSFRK